MELPNQPTLGEWGVECCGREGVEEEGGGTLIDIREGGAGFPGFPNQPTLVTFP